MISRTYIVLGSLFVLTACSATSDSNLTVIDQLRLQMEHNGALQVALTDSNGKQFAISDKDFSASASIKKYDVPSDGLGDWDMSSNFAFTLKKVQKCDQLMDGSYAVVDFTKPHLCKWMLSPDGIPIFYAVGYVFPYEGWDYLGSVIGILRNSDFIVMEVTTSFPKLDEALKQESDNFSKTHNPDDLWPPNTPDALAVYAHATELVDAAIHEPSSDVTNTMNLLEKIAQKIQKADY